MKTIYLAGKVGGAKWDAAPKHPYVKYVASDGGNHSEHNWNLSDYGKVYGDEHLKNQVQEAFIDVIKKSDALFAYLDTPYSYGSIAEIAYASALGIQSYVFIVFNKDRCWEDQWEDGSLPDAYWFVSNFPHVASFVVNTCDQASFLMQQLLGYVVSDSPIEDKLWEAMIMAQKSRPIPQYQLNGYRLDFAWPDQKVAVEVDGHDYHKTKEQRSCDAKRDRELAKLGWTTLRFTGSDVYRDADAVAQEILTFVDQAKE